MMPKHEREIVSKHSNKELVNTRNIRNWENEIFELIKTFQAGKSLKSILQDAISTGGVIFSVEICPSMRMCSHNWQSVYPVFYSITWHYERKGFILLNTDIPALNLASILHRRRKERVLLHLACKNLKKHDVLTILERAKRIGVKNIFALYGDPSTDQKQPKDRDFFHAVDLVKFIKMYYGSYFTIAVAAYPAGHPDCVFMEQDLYFLREKVEAGADFILTQIEFSVNVFSRFVRRCRQMNIDVPIIPSVFVPNSYESLQSLSSMCRIRLPDTVLRTLQSIKDNPLAVQAYGVFQATTIIKQLLDKQQFPAVVGFHVISLNRLENFSVLCKNLGFGKPLIERPIKIHNKDYGTAT